MIINPYSFSTAATDPYWSSVVLLLNGEGSNGGTTITDNSPSAKTPASNSGVTTSTSSPKFGVASLSMSGTQAVGYSASSDWAFGNGDFTVEYWIKTSTTAGQIMGMRVYQQAAWNCVLWSSAIYWQRFFADGNLYNYSFSSYLGNWAHVAHCRSGTTHKMFFNGSQVVSTTDSYNYNNSSQVLYIGGMSGGNGNFTGGLELRITKGVARYTATFTPPDSAFPIS